MAEILTQSFVVRLKEMEQLIQDQKQVIEDQKHVIEDQKHVIEDQKHVIDGLKSGEFSFYSRMSLHRYYT